MFGCTRRGLFANTTGLKSCLKMGENYGGMGESEGLQLPFRWEDLQEITRLKTSFTWEFSARVMFPACSLTPVCRES